MRREAWDGQREGESPDRQGSSRLQGWCCHRRTAPTPPQAHCRTAAAAPLPEDFHLVCQARGMFLSILGMCHHKRTHTPCSALASLHEGPTSFMLIAGRMLCAMLHKDKFHNPQHSVSADQEACGPQVQDAACKGLKWPACSRSAPNATLETPGLSNTLQAAQCNKLEGEIADLHQHTLPASAYASRYQTTADSSLRLSSAVSSH